MTAFASAILRSGVSARRGLGFMAAAFAALLALAACQLNHARRVVPNAFISQHGVLIELRAGFHGVSDADAVQQGTAAR